MMARLKAWLFIYENEEYDRPSRVPDSQHDVLTNKNYHRIKIIWHAIPKYKPNSCLCFHPDIKQVYIFFLISIWFSRADVLFTDTNTCIPTT